MTVWQLASSRSEVDRIHPQNTTLDALDVACDAAWIHSGSIESSRASPHPRFKIARIGPLSVADLVKF